MVYDINVDNDGDAEADLVYRWEFSSRYLDPTTFLYNTGVVTSLDDDTLNFRQTYDLSVSVDGGAFTSVLTDVPAAPSDTGQAGMPDYAALRAEAVTPLPGDVGQVYAGQADDPFYLDLRVFDLLYGGDLSEVGNDTLDGWNVNTLALQVPADVLAATGSAEANPVIGVWTTSSRPAVRTFDDDSDGDFGGATTDTGDLAQVSRLGNPLVNEVVVPVGAKDRFNNSVPARRRAVPARRPGPGAGAGC